ncbi:MAG: phospholipid carrier-dependent glycosyltransferase [Acidothermus sp.]|nr:phospholipid carrier-dependent glycosyltransferase [Acidothermus sp.]MCL6538429.1 phospholipid carrier-dependent glycosyltransferase [Acidothermus sp.]
MTLSLEAPITGARARARALRRRLVPPFPNFTVLGWLAPLLVTAFAGYLRFHDLGTPNSKIFDEVYYAHDAHSLLTHGVELNNTDNGPGYVVHPPLGKWMIAFGEWIFGDNSVGWRFSAAVVGTLAVLIVARTARRMTRSTLLGTTAGLLFSLDGLEFVQSRTSMLDIFLMFWIVAAFACLVLDRDQVRARLAAWAARNDWFTETYGPSGGTPPAPRIGVRWWFIATMFCLGAACATKWDGVYLLPAFGLLAAAWTMGARRAVGIRRPALVTLARDVPGMLAVTILVPLATYLVSWTGWFVNTGKYAWDRDWANNRPGWEWVPAWIRNPIRGLWHYHAEALNFHLHLSSYHSYRSNAWTWLFETRPVLYYADYPKPPNEGCRAAAGCARMIYDMGTPAIWWASIPVMLFTAYLILRRDWRGSALLVPFVFLYVPWLFTFHRTMFYFYALPLLPFICIALAIAIGYVLGPADASPTRRMVGATVAGSYVLIVVILFFYFLPILTAKTIPSVDWQQRMWFQSWSEANGS